MCRHGSNGQVSPCENPEPWIWLFRCRLAMYTYKYIYTYIHTYIYIHIHIHIHTYVRIYIYIYIYIYTYIYIYIHVFILVFFDESCSLHFTLHSMTLGWCVETYLDGCLTCRVSKDKYKSKFVQNPPKRAWAPLSPAIQGFAGHDWRQQWHALLQPKRDRVQQELGVLPSIVQLLGCLQVGTVIRLLNNLANVLVQMHSSIVQLKIRLICPFFLLGEYGSHIVHQMIQHDLMHWFTLKGQKASGTVSDKIMPAATCSHFPLSLLCTKDMSAFEDRFEDKSWQSLDSAWVLGCMILYVLNTSEYVSNKRFDLPQVTNFSFSPRILTLVSWTMSKTQARLLLGVSATREWFEFRKGNHMTQVEKWVCARACMIHSLEYTMQIKTDQYNTCSHENLDDHDDHIIYIAPRELVIPFLN